VTREIRKKEDKALFNGARTGNTEQRVILAAEVGTYIPACV
jgi:hypothetical protein